ncbi:MAG: [protein-PII] uridylyltransferase [Alphaproteobacteria bacterium]|nr:[protein-PII] uridylyltransferase [Alphaproteobacteria bacterium]
MSTTVRRVRLKPAKIEDVVDGLKLRAQLTAAALDHIGDEGGARKAAMRLLHGALFRGRMIAKERLEDGASGHETSRLLSSVADEVIRALYDFTTVHIFRSRNPTAGERFAIVAVGGYGRGQLGPSSDIDLLFLRAYKMTPWAESVTEYLLYALWDMSLKVGHSSRTVDECLRLAREDHTIQTALLEARHIAGDATLTEELRARYRKEVAIPGHRAFVQAKLKERDLRHARSGESPYMVEPNLKEGKGGLRDLHTIYWILKHQYGFENFGAFLRSGIFPREDLARFMRASDFLWTVRCHLHFLTGRAEERLTFDLQPEMAVRMGFGDRGSQAGVERFMKRFFLAAKDVGALTRIFAARLEVKAVKGMDLAAFFPSRTAKALDPPFALEGQRVTIADLAAFDRDPVNLLRLFQIADARGYDIHPDALAHAAKSLRSITPAVRRDPEAARVFLDCAAGKTPGRTLALMNEAGVLGRFVPEFGAIVAQMQFNMYHHFTVDEHTLRAVEVISEIEGGRFQAEHPLSTAIFPKIIHRRVLYLAMLLHDTGKGIGDQQIEGEKSARAACERLGLPAEEVDLVGWLVRNHLAMSDVAQKRDIGDPRTVANFTALVGDVERLRLLLVLTVADIRAVGPGVWNSWKGQLLRDLYRLTEAALHGGQTDEAGVRERLAAQARAAKEDLVARLGGITPQLETWLASLDDAYWISFDADALAWHARESTLTAPGGVHVAARTDERRGVTEVLVRAADRPGLFARLAAALAESGADVRDARAHTTRDGRAFDLFSVQDAAGMPFCGDNAHALERLLARVKRAAEDDAPLATPARRPAMRRAAAFAIDPWVRIDDDVSHASTVIEVSGRDRPGLLAALAKVLAEAELSIVSAHIDAYGERVADVFYVQEKGGGKLRDAARAERVTAELIAALRDGEPDAPADPRKQKLAVARASQGR